MALLRPYEEGRFAGNASKQRDFLNTALSRKRTLRRDFEQFYAEVLGKKDFRFEDLYDTLAPGKLGWPRKS